MTGRHQDFGEDEQAHAEFHMRKAFVGVAIAVGFAVLSLALSVCAVAQSSSPKERVRAGGAPVAVTTTTAIEAPEVTIPVEPPTPPTPPTTRPRATTSTTTTSTTTPVSGWVWYRDGSGQCQPIDGETARRWGVVEDPSCPDGGGSNPGWESIPEDGGAGDYCGDPAIGSPPDPGADCP